MSKISLALILNVFIRVKIDLPGLVRTASVKRGRRRRARGREKRPFKRYFILHAMMDGTLNCF